MNSSPQRSIFFFLTLYLVVSFATSSQNHHKRDDTGEQDTKESPATPPKEGEPKVNNDKGQVNETVKEDIQTGLEDKAVLNKDLLKRATYVVLALSAILVVYFGIRIVRSRKRKIKSYGLLSNGQDTVEMNPIASDSEDDMTVFDARRSLVKS